MSLGRGVLRQQRSEAQVIADIRKVVGKHRNAKRLNHVRLHDLRGRRRPCQGRAATTRPGWCPPPRWRRSPPSDSRGRMDHDRRVRADDSARAGIGNGGRLRSWPKKSATSSRPGVPGAPPEDRRGGPGPARPARSDVDPRAASPQDVAAVVRPSFVAAGRSAASPATRTRSGLPGRCRPGPADWPETGMVAGRRPP